MRFLPRASPPPDRPVARLTAAIILPQPEVGPVRAVLQRVVIALVVLFLVATVVWLDRDGYRDLDQQGLSYLDAVYYATVTLSTTGYGDITPVSAEARLVNILVITPLRVAFLIVLVGTTLEVLTQRTREQLRQNRWRSSLRDHTIVVGYGTKGRSAVRALLDDGADRAQIVVVDTEPDHIAEAGDGGLAAIHGDGATTRRRTSWPPSGRRRTPRCCARAGPAAWSCPPRRPAGCSG